MKRHRWQEVSRKRSMIHNTVSRCENCELERAQYMDFGHYRTAFRMNGGSWIESKTPICEQTREPADGI